MGKDAKSIWKESYRKKRVEERKINDDRIKLEDEIFEKEYLDKRDSFSKKIREVFASNLLLLVIPVIICINTAVRLTL